MCRLLAVAAADPIPVRHALMDAIDSLQNQSSMNMDGWGIAWFDDDDRAPRIVKDFVPAALSGLYETTAAAVSTRRLVAHIRAATCGTRGIVNTHPFRWGQWIFAHNGTVKGIDSFRDQLEGELPAHLRDLIQGNTDSELVFLTIISRAGLDIGGGTPRTQVINAVHKTINDLDQRSRKATGGPATINTLLSDGAHLYATRWGKGLWMRRVGGEHATGFLPLALQRAEPHRLEIASQPFTLDGGWERVPEGSMVVVGPGLDVSLRRIADQT